MAKGEFHCIAPKDQLEKGHSQQFFYLQRWTSLPFMHFLLNALFSSYIELEEGALIL